MPLTPSMAHRFGPHLVCLRPGCGISWSDHQESQVRCDGTIDASPDAQAQSDEESLLSAWVRSDYAGGEGITTLARRYSIGRARVSRILREG